MTTRRKSSALGPLRTVFNLGAVREMTDGQLLERFARGGEASELAFAALVERHGPVVLHACRSILRHEQDAEDAFQATFLVLVQKARSLWVRDSLGPWLHQVAYRAARCSRSAAARRADHERRAAETAPALRDRRGTEHIEEIGAAIHEEIARLPERFRGLLVLCDLEGRSHEQAARHLGCPVGTVKSRLARGRRRLGERLKRRGLDAAHAAPATGLLAPSASLAEATTRAAMQIAAGRPLAGVVPAAVSVLVKGVSGGFLMHGSRGIALAIVVGTLAGGLAWAGIGQPEGEQAKPPATQASRPAAGDDGPRPPGPVARDAAAIRGTWEVLYLAGTAAGGREGYPAPGLVVPVTDKTINLPALTGDPKSPMSYLGRMPYLLDAQARPGAIDMKGAPSDGQDRRGIYQLHGDVLTICFGGPDGGRPRTFACDRPTESLIILRRDRPTRVPPPPPNAPPPPPTAPAPR